MNLFTHPDWDRPMTAPVYAVFFLGVVLGAAFVGSLWVWWV